MSDLPVSLAYHKEMQSQGSKAQLLQEAQSWQMEHTLLLSMTVFTGASSPAGNLYCGNRLDRMSDSVLVLTVDECEVRYLPCAEGTCSAIDKLSIAQRIAALSSQQLQRPLRKQQSCAYARQESQEL